MPRAESTHGSPDEGGSRQARTTALIGLGIAAAIAVFTWFALTRATDAGIARLARIDRVRAACDSAWQRAGSDRDSAAVDGLSLPDTIDQGSSAQLARCGDLRPKDTPRRLPNPREMSGEPMPRGLR